MTTIHRDLAWAADLVQSLSGKAQFDAKDLVVAHGELRYFLESDETSKVIASGPRGMGKSIALAYKVSKLQSSSKYRTIPETFPFMYGLSKKSIPLTGEQLYELDKAQKWTSIWLATIGAFLAAWIRKEARATLETPANYPWSNDLIAQANKWAGSRAEPITAILAVAIKLASNKLESLYIDVFLPIIDDHKQDLAICVDSIDEAISYQSADNKIHTLFSSQPDLSFVDREEVRVVKFRNLANNAWIAAQQGYAEAAVRITKRFEFDILVLGSVRLEARHQLPKQLDDVESKWESWIEDLTVAHSDLKEIFVSNIQRSDPARMLKPDSTDPIEKFLGVTEIASRVVPDATESVISYILRHTFGTPRGMVQIGGAIYSKQPPGAARIAGFVEHQIDRLISTVNHCAAEVILEEHRAQLMPQLENSALEYALANVPHNILSIVEIGRLNAGYSEQFPGDKTPLSDHLFAAGLLGIPRKENGVWVQYFAGHHDLSGGKVVPPNTPFVFLHPAFSAKRCQANLTDYYRSTFLVGRGLPCPEYFYPSAISVKVINNMGRKRLVAAFECDKDEAVEFSLSPERSSYCLLFCLLFAIHGNRSSTVTVAQILEAAKDLSAAALLSESYGKPPLEPYKYLMERFIALDKGSAKGNEQSIRALTSWFNKETSGLWRLFIDDVGYGEKSDLTFSIQSKLTNRSSSRKGKSFGDIDYLDVDLRVRLEKRILAAHPPAANDADA